MTIRHDRHRSTNDIDFVLRNGNRHVVQDAIERTAEKHELQPDWMNELQEDKRPETPDADEQVTYQGKSLTVIAAGAERLIAMKLEAGRRKDKRDIARLCERIGIHEPAALTRIHQTTYGPSSGPRKKRIKDRAEEICNNPDMI